MANKTKEQREAEVVQKIVDDYTWAKDYRTQFKTDWDRYFRLYRSRVVDPSVKYPFESEIFIPYVFSIIETQLPILMQQVFSGPEFVKVLGRNIDDEINAPLVNDILKYQFERDIKAFEFAYLWAKQALLYGTSPCVIDWRYKTRKVKARVPDVSLNGTFLGERTIAVQKVLENNPHVEVLDINRYFQCPTTPQSPATSHDVLFAGWEGTSTRDELLLDMKNGIYNDNVKKITEADGDPNAFQYLEDRLSILGKTGPINDRNDSRPQIPLVNYFGVMPDSKGDLISKHFVVAFPSGFPQEGGDVGGILILEEENPFHHERIPVALLRVNQMPGELYGIGDIEMVESLQIELTDQRNQRNDNITRQMHRMWKVKTTSKIDEAQLQYHPDGIIEVDDVNDIQELVQNPSQLNNAFAEGEEIKRDMQFASGISDFVVGQFQNSSGFNDTATGISLIQAAAQNRLVLKGQFLQVGIKDVAEMVWMLDQQFLPFDTVIRVLDPDSASRYRFVKATPAVIQGQYDFSIVNSPSTGNPQVRQQQILQVLTTLTQILPIAQQAQQPLDLNYGNLMKRVLEEFQIPNLAEIFPALADKPLMNDIPDLLDQAEGAGNSLDSETENALIIEQGATDLPVHPGDDDLEHLLSHDAAKEQASARAITELEKHQILHKTQMEVKRRRLAEEVRQNRLAIEGGNILEETLGSQSEPASESKPDGESPNGAGGAEQIIQSLADTTRLVGG